MLQYSKGKLYSQNKIYFNKVIIEFTMNNFHRHIKYIGMT